jgi:hypothetical protein
VAPKCSTGASSLSRPGVYPSSCAGAVDSNYLISYSNGSITVGFSQACITKAVSGSLTVANGQSVCIATGGRVAGSVTVTAGGALWLSGGTISGALSSSGALGITICDATIGGAVSVGATKGPVVMGGSNCARDSVAGNVGLTGNSQGVVFSNNVVSGALTVSINAGGTTISGNTIAGGGTVTGNTNGLAFVNNTLAGSLVITNNTGGFTFSGNSIRGSVTNSKNS